MTAATFVYFHCFFSKTWGGGGGQFSKIACTNMGAPSKHTKVQAESFIFLRLQGGAAEKLLFNFYREIKGVRATAL